MAWGAASHPLRRLRADFDAHRGGVLDLTGFKIFCHHYLCHLRLFGLHGPAWRVYLNSWVEPSEYT